VPLPVKKGKKKNLGVLDGGSEDKRLRPLCWGRLKPPIVRGEVCGTRGVMPEGGLGRKVRTSFPGRRN